MKIENYTTTVINAEEGNYLTQVADVDIMKRLIVRTVALGRYDSAENWKEIPEEEAQSLLEEQSLAREQFLKD